MLLIMIFSYGCYKQAPQVKPWTLAFNTPEMTATLPLSPQKTAYVAPVIQPQAQLGTPTPDAERIMPTVRAEEVDYFVQANDSLSVIARTYGVDLNALMAANQIYDPNYLEVGQELTIPTADPNMEPSSFKIIPDSELVYSPSAVGFDVSSFLSHFSGYLSTLAFADDVVLQVAEDYSINPRILLVAFEYQTKWLTSSNQSLDSSQPAPTDAWKTNVFQVLSVIADNLNRGFYQWQSNQIAYFILKDGSYIPASSVINAGTAAVQYWASTRYDKSRWFDVVSENGLITLYQQYFGDPFQYSIDPLIPEDLDSPQFILPFERDVAWSFTGGPHPSWGDGSAWGALDFAPPGSPMGCVVSGDWVTAIADGLIVRNEFGEVLQDLDGDGVEQSGWEILYMHISSWQQVQAGTYVKAGDPIGHASCEGGISSGSHLHLARKYNGVWIAADSSIPFVLDGYRAESSGLAYDGFLVKNGAAIEAWGVYRPESLVAR